MCYCYCRENSVLLLAKIWRGTHNSPGNNVLLLCYRCCYCHWCVIVGQDVERNTEQSRLLPMTIHVFLDRDEKAFGQLYIDDGSSIGITKQIIYGPYLHITTFLQLRSCGKLWLLIGWTGISRRHPVLQILCAKLFLRHINEECLGGRVAPVNFRSARGRFNLARLAGVWGGWLLLSSYH